MRANSTRLLATAVFALVFLFAIANQTQSVRAAGSWYVTTSGNDSNDCTSPATACASINGTLNKPGFVAGDTIYVAVGTYTGTGTEVVLLNKNATVSGGWDASFTTQSGVSTIDAGGARKGITVNSGVVAFVEYLKIQNGFDTMSVCCGGGGIGNYGGMLTISNSNVISNTSSYPTGWASGGGIYSTGNLTLTNSVVSGNVGDFGGGGIEAYATTIIMSSTIVGNTAGKDLYSGGGGGGGIEARGIMTVTNSTVDGNNLNGWFSGSGINSFGTLTLINSTVSGNTNGNPTDYYANGIENYSTLNLASSTVSNNVGGGGIGNTGTVTLKNTIIANNATTDCINFTGYNGTINSFGYNLVRSVYNCPLAPSDLMNVDPLLGPLQNNGGSTLTQELLSTSPAVDGGNPAGCADNQGNTLSFDQRGFPRFGRCDIGAYELQPLGFSLKTANPNIASPNDSVNYSIKVSNPGNNILLNITVTDTLPITLKYNDNSLTATSGNYGYSSGVITWTGTLNANTNTTISFSATLNSNAPIGSSISNTAIIVGGETFSRTVPISVVNPLNFSSKTVQPINSISATPVIYTISISNTSTSNLSNVAITDTLPAALSYVANSLTASNGTYIYSNGMITWTGSVSARSNTNVMFSAIPHSSNPGGSSITNTVVIDDAGTIITRTAFLTVSPQLALLPLIAKPPYVGINGRVTYSGSPVAGISLELRFFNGSSWSTIATTSTAGDGSYKFLNAPSLNPGQAYYVRYLNPSNTDSSRLCCWFTRVLTSYTAGTNVAIGDFDIANIFLQSPSPGATVSLPNTFQWGVRSATPSDSYEWDLQDLNNQNLYYFTPPLGYVNSYTLNTIPPGFATGTYYGWYVAVWSPDGGYGISFYFRYVAFSNTGSSPDRLAPVKPRNPEFNGRQFTRPERAR